MKKRIYIFASILVILLAIVNNACDKDKPVEIFGSISGTVKDAKTGEAIKNVLMTIDPGSAKPITDEDGKFRFDELEPQNYELTATVDGYETVTESNIKVEIGKNTVVDFTLNPIQPELNLSVAGIDFGTDVTSLTIDITNKGKGELEWSISEDVPWINVNPVSGTTTTETDNITISVNRDNLDQGSYSQTISVTSNGGSKSIDVSMEVLGPTLTVSPLDLNFGTSETQKVLSLTNSGIGTLSYNASTTDSWIQITPVSGTLTNETDLMEISVDRTGLSYGNYEGSIVLNTNSNTVRVYVYMTIPDPNAPQLSLNTLNMNFGTTETEKTLTVTNSGQGTLDWSLTESKDWMTVSLNSGTLEAGQSEALKVTIDRSGLAPDTYIGGISVSSNGGNLNCNVSMEVSAEPSLAYSPQTLDFGRDETALTFTISNSGNGDLDWTLSKNQDWISISPTSGTNQGTVNVNVDRTGLSYGSYSGEVTIQSNGGTGKVIIDMEYNAPNEAPNAVFTVEPEKGETTTDFYVNAGACSDDYTASENLELRWQWETGGVWTEWTTDKTATHRYDNIGSKTIKLEVRDEEGAIGSTTKVVEVVQNQPPTASFTVSPTEGDLTTMFNVDASGSTDDLTAADELQIRWQWEDGTDFTAWTTNKTAGHQYDTYGTKTITLEVKDGNGTTNSASQTVELINPLPTVTISEPSYNGGESVDVTSEITDMGTSNISERGLCWSTEPNPTIADNKTDLGATMSAGSFSSTITEMEVPQTYYIRAYATNDAGTAYSNEISISTYFTVGMFYGGGVIFYVDDTKLHGLICAVKDQSAGIRWDSGSYQETGATETAIGAGQSNTNKIIAVMGGGSYAAQICNDLSLNGYDDWFLPSKDELNQMWQNRNTINITASNNGGEYFSSDYYWSSSEESYGVAWTIVFSSTGYWVHKVTNSIFRVRTIRSF